MAAPLEPIKSRTTFHSIVEFVAYSFIHLNINICVRIHQVSELRAQSPKLIIYAICCASRKLRTGRFALTLKVIDASSLTHAIAGNYLRSLSSPATLHEYGCIIQNFILNAFTILSINLLIHFLTQTTKHLSQQVIPPNRNKKLKERNLFHIWMYIIEWKSAVGIIQKSKNKNHPHLYIEKKNSPCKHFRSFKVLEQMLIFHLKKRSFNFYICTFNYHHFYRKCTDFLTVSHEGCDCECLCSQEGRILRGGCSLIKSFYVWKT